jgi:hypothetical protein
VLLPAHDLPGFEVKGRENSGINQHYEKKNQNDFLVAHLLVVPSIGQEHAVFVVAQHRMVNGFGCFTSANFAAAHIMLCLARVVRPSPPKLDCCVVQRSACT